MRQRLLRASAVRAALRRCDMPAGARRRGTSSARRCCSPQVPPLLNRRSPAHEVARPEGAPSPQEQRSRRRRRWGTPRYRAPASRAPAGVCSPSLLLRRPHSRRAVVDRPPAHRAAALLVRRQPLLPPLRHRRVGGPQAGPRRARRLAGTEPALDHAAPPPRQPLPRPHAAAERTEHRGGADSVSRESSMFAVRLLLRAGASPRAAAAGVANAPTPLSLARQSSSAAAALVPFPTPLVPTHTRHTDTPRHLHATQRHTSRLAPPHMLVVILSCD